MKCSRMIQNGTVDINRGCCHGDGLAATAMYNMFRCVFNERYFEFDVLQYLFGIARGPNQLDEHPPQEEITPGDSKVRGHIHT